METLNSGEGCYINVMLDYFGSNTYYPHYLPTSTSTSTTSRTSSTTNDRTAS